MSNCVICGATATDPILKEVWYDPEHPSIDIGPYCNDCAPYVRRCNSCFHLFHKEKGGINYFGKGVYYCTSCESDAIVCEFCDTMVIDPVEVHGAKMCHSCYRMKYVECDCCLEHTPKENIINDGLTLKQYKGLFKKWGNVCETCFNKNKKRFKKYDVELCKFCGTYYTPGNGDKKGYCASCISRGHVVECSGCGDIHHEYRMFTSGDSVDEKSTIVLCNSCQNKYYICKCGSASINPEVIKGILGNIKVCKRCYSGGVSQCPKCLDIGELSGNGYCNACNKHYVENICVDCGHIKDHNGMCRICLDSTIYPYSFRPHLQFHYTDKDVRNREKIFFGIEFETTYGSHSSKMQKALEQLYREVDSAHIYCKSDSSISGSGYEMVTHPMTLSYYHTKFPVESMFNSDQMASKSCGMHIHIDRRSIKSEVHLYKIMDFIHNNREFVNKVCGRDYSSYNSRMECKVSSAIKSKGGRTGRHCRINITSPSTVEFRMFSQPRNPFEIGYRVEFTVAIFKWTRDIPIRGVNKDGFVSFIERNKKEFPNLFKFISN